MATLRLDLTVALKGTYAAAAGLTTKQELVDFTNLIQLTAGTGANQADLFWASERTLAASATEDLDLAGVLADAFGTTVTAVKIVAILVVAVSGNTNNVVLGDATQPVPLFGGTNPTFAVKPGGVFLVAAPAAAGLLTVGAGATDDLKVTNSAGTTSVTYKIFVAARSA